MKGSLFKNIENKHDVPRLLESKIRWELYHIPYPFKYLLFPCLTEIFSLPKMDIYNSAIFNKMIFYGPPKVD